MKIEIKDLKPGQFVNVMFEDGTSWLMLVLLTTDERGNLDCYWSDNVLPQDTMACLVRSSNADHVLGEVFRLGHMDFNNIELVDVP